MGRDTGFQLKNGTTIENQATYGYGATDGRLATVIGGGDVSSPQTFTYGYAPNSSLLQTVTGPIHTVTNSWEPTRDVLASKQNKAGTTVISQYDYTVNAIGQRTGVNTSGTAFPALPSWLWGYDSLGQLTSADSSVDISDRAYEYDAIGNRKKSANSLTLPGNDNYTSNALNQYSVIQPQQGSTGVSPVYDDDGNATAYPLPVAPTTNSTLVWDAENRQVSTTAGTTTTTYLYDAHSRRIAKTTSGISTLYINDGWNCIAEYEGGTGVPPVLKKTRLWGTDLSGSLQGAGGVGGLLSESQISNSQISNYYPTYDGNGNVSEYLTSNGTVTAHFEYDPFGNTVVATGMPELFNYRFSTKPLDVETGFYYYGYRYYDPITGRWPSRDPIGERGGINLYAFVGNDGVNKWDVLGLRWNIGSSERTQAVRDKIKAQLDVLAQEIISQGRRAGVPLACKLTARPAKVLVDFERKVDVAFASMYFTGFFALGGVSVNLVGTGEYSYDCCERKPIDYHVDIDASFSDDFDELINISEPGWGDTGITFSGSWVEQYDGSF